MAKGPKRVKQSKRKSNGGSSGQPRPDRPPAWHGSLKAFNRVTLPIFGQIASHLDAETLLRLYCSCRKFHGFLRKLQPLWKRVRIDAQLPDPASFTHRKVPDDRTLLALLFGEYCFDCAGPARVGWIDLCRLQRLCDGCYVRRSEYTGGNPDLVDPAEAYCPAKVARDPRLLAGGIPSSLPTSLVTFKAQAPRAALDKLTTRLSELKPAHDAVVAQRAAAVASGVEASARETPYEQLTRERASFKQTVEQSANILATAYEGYYARLRQAEIDENQRKIDEAAAIERVKVQRREEIVSRLRAVGFTDDVLLFEGFLADPRVTRAAPIVDEGDDEDNNWTLFSPRFIAKLTEFSKALLQDKHDERLDQVFERAQAWYVEQGGVMEDDGDYETELLSRERFGALSVFNKWTKPMMDDAEADVKAYWDELEPTLAPLIASEQLKLKLLTYALLVKADPTLQPIESTTGSDGLLSPLSPTDLATVDSELGKYSHRFKCIRKDTLTLEPCGRRDFYPYIVQHDCSRPEHMISGTFVYLGPGGYPSGAIKDKELKVDPKRVKIVQALLQLAGVEDGREAGDELRERGLFACEECYEVEKEEGRVGKKVEEGETKDAEPAKEPRQLAFALSIDEMASHCLHRHPEQTASLPKVVFEAKEVGYAKLNKISDSRARRRYLAEDDSDLSE